jgi:hypothetical protein
MNWWEDPTRAAHYVLWVAGWLPETVSIKQPGGFAKLLVETIFRADPQQRAILRRAYPVFVDTVMKYENEEHGHEELAELVRKDSQ